MVDGRNRTRVVPLDLGDESRPYRLGSCLGAWARGDDLLEAVPPLGHRLDAQIRCSAPEVKDFTAEQLAALHVFKHELLSSMYRLYLQVPQAMADPILKKFFSLTPDGLENVQI